MILAREKRHRSTRKYTEVKNKFATTANIFPSPDSRQAQYIFYDNDFIPCISAYFRGK